jgi:hypothetical protein
MTNKTKLVMLLLTVSAGFIFSCNRGEPKTETTISESSNQEVDSSTKAVTLETFNRAETDRMFFNITQLTRGINKFFHFKELVPLDKQTVVRMNLDVLYSGAIVDVEKGATVTFPEIPKGRYASILLIDNDHYAPLVIYKSGKHKLPQDTKYLGLAVRIQIFNPEDPAEIALVNKLQDQFTIESNSADEFPKPTWNKLSLDSLRVAYEKEFSTFDTYPDDWMGPRGTVNEQTRHLATAGAWGLFPNKDAAYINYNGGNLSGDKCYVATYTKPDVGAFWSFTIYGKDGFLKSTNSVINASNVKYNKDGKTFTIHFGAKDKCPINAKNRVDISDGWNFLVRAYLPGESVLNRTYKLPDVTEVK